MINFDGIPNDRYSVFNTLRDFIICKSIRSNPDGIAVTLACIEKSDLRYYETRHFDGENWEQFYQQSEIGNFSK